MTSTAPKKPGDFANSGLLSKRYSLDGSYRVSTMLTVVQRLIRRYRRKSPRWLGPFIFRAEGRWRRRCRTVSMMIEDKNSIQSKLSSIFWSWAWLGLYSSIGIRYRFPKYTFPRSGTILKNAGNVEADLGQDCFHQKGPVIGFPSFPSKRSRSRVRYLKLLKMSRLFWGVDYWKPVGLSLRKTGWICGMVSILRFYCNFTAPANFQVHN